MIVNFTQISNIIDPFSINSISEKTFDVELLKYFYFCLTFPALYVSELFKCITFFLQIERLSAKQIH